ncbi:ABC transporter ATP-binding protein [Clostridium estertheticum]|uniref:ABC transporter ATP-binding protein n=1 Tax=Clostridium estertheticum TaxID=238834 RepID=UPI001C6DE18A|nr:ATP-binding cassette domain-containing protein [Clostridium estertheticum]MBW9151676.1 ABC transporter ATP-binding protein [Clostridium estertheticum]WLC83199.1 ABC transporter ATP-binding protein [Clostridium estertheticum]
MIEMENVTKRYGNQVALDGLNLTVKKGEILGFLGPNGAGKSTAMNILTGYISATNGNVRIDGIDILENPEDVKKKIGYLPEIPPLYLDMTVEEYLKFVFRIKKVKSDSIEQSMIKIMSLVKILDVKGRLIKNLSKGYKQRIGLAQALVGDPEVLVLDEPTVGLDPKQIIEIRNLIQKIGKTCTVILSSHILSEVSAICHRVIIIKKGKIVASGTPEELAKGVNNSNKVLLRVKGVKEDVYKHIKAVEDVKSVEVQGVHEIGTVDLLVEAKNNLDIRETLFVTLSQAGFIILMMKSKEINLEEIFLDVTTNKKVGGM